MAMERKVGIAELKSRLSEYLRAVRRGHSLLVLDRETPVARMIPYESAPERLVLRRSRGRAPRLAEIPMPPPLRFEGDIVDFLLVERQGGR
jgi:prevent-host-death family protein